MYRHVFKPFLALAGGVALMSYFGSRIYPSMTLPSEINVRSSDKIPNSFARSFAASAVNPHHHITVNDTRSVVVSVSGSLTHEQILAKFLAGFFGGYIFAPERMALRLLSRTLVDFKGGQRRQPPYPMGANKPAELKGIPVSTEFWTAEDIDEARVPPLHSVLFGAFRVVDSKWSDYPGTSVKTSRAQYSCIDLAFGSDDGFIAGVHRFSVSEVEGSTNIESKRLVSINFDHFSCNPKENKLLGPSVLQTFHLWYAILLFREGIASVLKAG